VTDGLPGIALTSERENPNTLKQPPRDPTEGLFARGLGKHIAWAGSLIALLTLATSTWAYHSGSPAWQSMAFVTLTFTQLAHVLAVRSETRSLRSLGLFSNIPLLFTVIGTLGLQLLTLYWAPLSRMLKTQPLSALELAAACGASAVVLVAVELEKSFFPPTSK
jgi:Ca2+-transporting ATPase